MITFQPNVDLRKAFHSQVMLINESAAAENGLCSIEAGADGPPLHKHPNQEEYFKILVGQLDIFRENKWTSLQEGEEFLIPKNTAHSYRSRHHLPCIFEYRLTPGGQFSDMVKTFEQLIHENKLCGTSDLKSIIHLAMTFKKYSREVRSVNPPAFVIDVMAFIGRHAGYKV